MERVSWEDCKAFLKKLDAKFGDKIVKFSLPTEAQWEYACRAGKTTKYCFGDKEADLGRYAWFIENSKDKIHPVGEKKPNAWGLYDVHGDAWEWCADWYDKAYYKTSPANDPPGPASGTFRVCRGSSWESMARRLPLWISPLRRALGPLPLHQLAGRVRVVGLSRSQPRSRNKTGLPT